MLNVTYINKRLMTNKDDWNNYWLENKKKKNNKIQ